jgi:hypothetical protein
MPETLFNSHFLVDFETSTVLNYGELSEMIDLMDQSHGNLFVVSYENLNAQMKLQLQGENK